ncbi:hypothetical protein PF005_g19255 [Phytophthora fragariae]|uniref:Uncharacterized protein n=1 Tax=Phytophthora fragariae TaxID=53985 RepID=A0A6A4CM93_9STRA|nr:hypothetical protein PF003_g22845 [Phytophthora fragariae]KAE8931451.1 hypothetical protein PF009_g18486 [Phytophthora fragariae]KAE8991026.1 hypothetical protein PF011_g18107 [Phytophthora fragariae]KAE9090354.1 hypothetical protein PF010_g18612 [Phytophthora fragariae]KAE9091079.1 hypothetical protein PF007_g19009 [Phytophthora fragariae]
MIPRSYAAKEEESGRPKWLLFVREQDSNTSVFTAVVTLHTRNVVAELCVDDDALKQHSEELGLEMDADAFKKLLLKALEQRDCVDIELETEDETVKEIFLSLTYKFSPTISRRGLFQLPIVAADAPPSLVTLLASVHAAPPQSLLSEQQRRKKKEQEEQQAVAAAAKIREGSGDQNSSSGSQEDRRAAPASQSSDNGTTTPAVNPMVLKRRRVPTGTMRRKGPRGAKLAKK